LVSSISIMAWMPLRWVRSLVIVIPSA
jgi:hypothetical protein